MKSNASAVHEAYFQFRPDCMSTSDLCIEDVCLSVHQSFCLSVNILTFFLNVNKTKSGMYFQLYTHVCTR